ncbi:MAG: DUF2934 domain-containing protein [Gallionellaceae bacterium]
MAATTKKITPTGKKTAGSEVKKPATKKVAAGTLVTAKTAAVTTAKKPAAKTPAKKPVVKKEVLPKPAAEEGKPARKPAVKKSAPKQNAVAVSPEQRYQMISIAAYFKAERRGFAGGYEMQDWISAEAEVDAMLTA